MNYSNQGIQLFIDEIHDEIRKFNNKPISFHQKKIDLLKTSLTKIRLASLYYGANADKVIMTYLNALIDFKDSEYVINFKRQTPNSIKHWESPIPKYLVTANPIEIIYFNHALEIITDKAFNAFMENYKQPIRISINDEILIERMGIICREDMKNYQGIKLLENKYDIEMSEAFVRALNNSQLKDFNEKYNEILMIGTQQRKEQDYKLRITNESQKTLFDF